jgi:hypothetical protein
MEHGAVARTGRRSRHYGILRAVQTPFSRSLSRVACVAWIALVACTAACPPSPAVPKGPPPEYEEPEAPPPPAALPDAATAAATD